jgi:hypothetical protein
MLLSNVVGGSQLMKSQYVNRISSLDKTWGEQQTITRLGMIATSSHIAIESSLCML